MIQKTFSKKPIIIADYREKEIIELLKNKKEINLIVKNLKKGDFIVGDCIIERKSFSDFLSSIIDKRIFKQVSEISEEGNAILILEGPFHFTRDIHPNAYYGAITSLILKEKIKIIFSFSKEETAKYIYWLAREFHKKEKNMIFTVPKKKNKNEKEIIIQILSSFPGISYKTAQKILESFGNIYNFVNAKPYQLTKILGEKRAKKIIKIIRG